MLPPAPRFTAPTDRLTYHPTERRVRGAKGDTVVVDSRRALLVWEPHLPVPFYAFPLADVVAGALRPAQAPPTDGSRAGSVFHDLVVDGVVTPNAAWTYPGEVFAGTVCFAWRSWAGHGMDRWHEEDEEIFVHPRDPFERVDALASSRHVVVAHDGVVLADTRRPVLLFETGLPTRFYLPVADIAPQALIPTPGRSTRCPYKGIASYWSLATVPGPAGAGIAWSYEDPLPGVANIAGLIAFYPDRVTITVDGEPA